MYAFGPDLDLASNSQSSNLRRHCAYGIRSSAAKVVKNRSFPRVGRKDCLASGPLPMGYCKWNGPLGLIKLRTTLINGWIFTTV